MLFELNTAKIVARLKREGWEDVGGTKHGKFRMPGVAGIITVPRHRQQSVGLARRIAYDAGWIKESK